MCTDRGTAGQRGALLLEWMVVAVLTLALGIWASQEWPRQARALQAQTLAVWMTPARAALAAFLRDEHTALQQAQGPGDLLDRGIADWRRPSWDALQAGGWLSGTWQPRGPAGLLLEAHVWREGLCPGATCRLAGLVNTAGPILQPDSSATPDAAFMAEWLLAARGHGLAMWPRDSGAFVGAGHRQPAPPRQDGRPWSPGMLALLAAGAGAEGGSIGLPGADDTEAFLRVGDTRDPDFQGGATIQGRVRSASQLVAADSLVLESGHRVDTACGESGAVARDRAQPGLLVCEQGRWQLVARAGGGAFLFNDTRGCVNILGVPTINPVTGQCSCGSGHFPVQVSESGSPESDEGVTTGYLCLPN